MSVQKKSLISSRPTESKPTTEPAKETAAIGASKGLTANALRRPSYKASNALKQHSFKTSDLVLRAMKKKK